MRIFSLLCSLLLLVACSSNTSTGTSLPEEGESKYSQSLPATDFDAEQPAKVEPAVSPENSYGRQFVLEEEVIAGVREGTESPSAGSGAAEDVQTPVERPPIPPLNKTYTLQLAAFKEMQQAVDYAQRYSIDADQAGVARIMTKGELWYVLAYGVYTSREDADRAKAELQSRGVPEPWVRTLSTLETLSREASENGF